VSGGGLLSPALSSESSEEERENIYFGSFTQDGAARWSWANFLSLFQGFELVARSTIEVGEVFTEESVRYDPPRIPRRSAPPKAVSPLRSATALQTAGVLPRYSAPRREPRPTGA